MKTLAPATHAPHTVMMVNTCKQTIKKSTFIISFTHMFHIEHILVPDSEEQQNGEDRATNEGDVPGEDSGEGRDEDIHVVGGGLVSSSQTGRQLVFQFIEMPDKQLF